MGCASQSAKTFSDAVKGRSDDPLFIHSEAYDKLVSQSHAPYLEYFDADLDTGSWAATNSAAVGKVMTLLDSVSDKGKRVLVISDASRKYWLLRELTKRNDITIIDPIPFFTNNQASRNIHPDHIRD